METVILVVHILACVAMTGLVLVQKSEGGALGIGGGGGGMMSGRGAAGALVRTTIIFGGIFFITSLALTTMASRSEDGQTSIERSLEEASDTAPDTPTGDILDPNTQLFQEQLGDGVDPLLDDDAASNSAIDADPLATPETTEGNPPQ